MLIARSTRLIASCIVNEPRAPTGSPVFPAFRWSAAKRTEASPREVRVACKGLPICLSRLPPVDRSQVDHYLVTPVLFRPPEGNEDIEIYPYVSIETPDAATRLELGRVLAFGATHRFEVAAVDRQGRISATAVSAEDIVGPAP